MHRTCLAVILAAGDSTRMKSSMSNVLHPIAGLPMIAHVMASIAASGVSDVALVLGRDADKVEAAAKIGELTVESVLQTERLGTGHAVLMARELVGSEPFAVLLADDVIERLGPPLAGNDLIGT